MRLLVVEDNADCLKALKFMLESKGAEVQAAASAQQARAALVARRPHVVISDLSLPGEDGFSFLASVRALPPDRGSQTPAVAFSAMSPLHARVRAGEAGFQAFLRKPGDLLLLVPTVVRLMSLALAP
ncbi:MAG TPA: response regulator [Vicinamibacteria bacterium]|nr:response regulator [Vicinamibacteria bacterium]